MVITALALDGLDNHSARREMPRLDELLDLIEGSLLSGGVLGLVLIERVFELGESRLRPVEGRHVKFMNGLRARGGQRAEETAVEGRFERQDGELGSAGGLVVHDGGEFLLGEVDVVAAALLLATVHERSLEGELVGVRAGEGCVDVVEALGGNFEDAGAENVGPVVGREVARGRTVDEGVDHLGGGSGFGERGVVVANGDGGNLSISGLVSNRVEETV